MFLKTICLFTIAFFCTEVLTAEETTYTISEAIRLKKVSVKLNGADRSGNVSSHYGPCMEMQLTNLTQQSFTVKMPTGYLLVPDDSSLQTMIVTQSLTAGLTPQKKSSLPVFAMCTEAHDGAPSPEMLFKVSHKATGHLLGVVELIDKKSYQTDAAQNAVWCITDNHNLSSIWSSDTSMMYELRRFVAAAKKLSLKDVYADRETYSQPKPEIIIRKIYSGSLSYSVINPVKIFVALFDESDKMVRIYVNNETQKEGKYTYTYQITSSEMSEGKHFLRMFRDGKLEKEILLSQTNE